MGVCVCLSGAVVSSLVSHGEVEGSSPVRAPPGPPTLRSGRIFSTFGELNMVRLTTSPTSVLAGHGQYGH